LQTGRQFISFIVVNSKNKIILTEYIENEIINEYLLAWFILSIIVNWKNKIILTLYIENEIINEYSLR